ncbi:hypothetical protein E4633_13570 [Geomonas terrae]|uniref:CheR-type methyltransferase domain-containing protein n=1 Tax=Geomonas terrae TaxID=2562681 RepID=A0A4S1CEB9_9BACT|nr:CheR family methyltransferase [Geomonas terrae]TGU71360.1 hypothetical protein E4633_13570 [Geomonas terrae]
MTNRSTTQSLAKESAPPVAERLSSEPFESRCLARNDLSHIYFEGAVRPARPCGRKRPVVQPSSRVGEGHLAQVAGKQQELDLEAPPDPFLAWLLGRFGLDASAYRSAALTRRLPSCLRQLHVSTAGEAKAALELRPELLGPVLNTVLIGVTEFFRDRQVFEYLRDGLLPQLSVSTRGLRVLSAGCSDGQELYSVAMLLEGLGALEGSELVGIDCRAAAIDRARGGLFDARETAGLATLLSSAHARAGVPPALRERCRWHVGDLLSCDLGKGWDIILCRNVAIYLNAAHAERLWARLTSALAPGGVLVLGRVEKPPPSLPLVRVAASVYRRTGE